MRWKLMIAACFLLVAPALEGAATAPRPQGTQPTHPDDRKAVRRATAGKVEHRAERDLSRTADSASPRTEREREEHDHDRDDD